MEKRAKEFYTNRNLDSLPDTGANRWGLEKDSVKIAMDYMFYKRHEAPMLTIGHRSLCLARLFNSDLIKWKHRPWWKRIFQGPEYPHTKVWEYCKWPTPKK